MNILRKLEISYLSLNPLQRTLLKVAGFSLFGLACRLSAGVSTLTVPTEEVQELIQEPLETVEAIKQLLVHIADSIVDFGQTGVGDHANAIQDGAQIITSGGENLTLNYPDPVDGGIFDTVTLAHKPDGGLPELGEITGELYPVEQEVTCDAHPFTFASQETAPVTLGGEGSGDMVTEIMTVDNSISTNFADLENGTFPPRVDITDTTIVGQRTVTEGNWAWLWLRRVGDNLNVMGILGNSCQIGK